MNRDQLIEIENKNRALLATHTPEIFKEVTIFENNELLKRFGIKFPNPRSQSIFSIKESPSDFIVEEVDQSGTTHTIQKENDFELKDDPQGKTIYATLVKENVNTLDAISIIAKMLKIDTSNITYAGLKDKDAITSQCIAIRNTTTGAVKSLTSNEFFLKNIYIGKGVLHPGSLTGNTFTITLRGDVTDSDFEQVQKNVQTIEEEGFYNFFYLQRFGVPRLCNFVWAIEILKGNFEKACVDYLLRQTDYEFQFVKNIRKNIKQFVNDGDWLKVLYFLEMFPLAFQTEISLVRHLTQKPNDFKGAFLQIRDQVQLWTYGLASLLFNTKLSELSASDINKSTPENLPTFLSTEQADFNFYKEILGPLGIESLPSSILSYYKIPVQKRDTPTKNQVIIHEVSKNEKGLVLKFTLPKGSYATTFLSHLVTLKTSANPFLAK
jgi:TruD family tRNA pseudouridine synthase